MDSPVPDSRTNGRYLNLTRYWHRGGTNQHVAPEGGELRGHDSGSRIRRRIPEGQHRLAARFHEFTDAAQRNLDRIRIDRIEADGLLTLDEITGGAGQRIVKLALEERAPGQPEQPGAVGTAPISGQTSEGLRNSRQEEPSAGRAAA